MSFADRLRELREQAGLTQTALAEASGLSIGAIRNYEQGIREPYWVAVFKLADALGVSSEAFRGCIDAGGQAEEPAKGTATGQAGAESAEGPRKSGRPRKADAGGKAADAGRAAQKRGRKKGT